MYTEPRMKDPGVSGLLLKQFSHLECEKTSTGSLWQSLVEFATSTRPKVGKKNKNNNDNNGGILSGFFKDFSSSSLLRSHFCVVTQRNATLLPGEKRCVRTQKTAA